MAERRQRRKINKVLFSAVLTLALLLSSAAAAFAWYDFTQSYTNTFSGSVSKTKVILHKYAKTPAGDILQDPVAGAQFLLYRVSGANQAQIGGLYTTDSSGKITVTGLGPGSYMFREQAPSYGYTYDLDAAGAAVTDYPFTITLDDAQGTTPVYVEAYNRQQQSALEIRKAVTNADGSALTPQQQTQDYTFTVNFADGGTYNYQIDGGAVQSLVSGNTLTLKQGQTALFSNLPVGLHYDVYETPGPDYVTTSSGNSGSIIKDALSSAVFTNIYGMNTTGKTQITVEKIVAGNDIPASESGRAFGFTMTVNNDAPTRFTLKAGESKTFELNSGDAYTITEDDPFPYGYLQSAVVNGSGTACAPVINVTYTNTYVGPVMATISGEKTWDLGNDPAAHLPNSVAVQLLANGVVVQTATVRQDTAGKWLYSFTAPQYDGAGQVIAYTVAEAPVAGFQSVVTGTNIKNTWIKTVTATPAQVQKVISGIKPAQADVFSFLMTPQAGAPMPQGTVNGAKTITIAGEGTANFGSITYTAPGTYSYLITEVKGNSAYIYDTAAYTLTVVVGEQAGQLTVSSA
ncbi:MAG: Cna B-type domain-containing protein, partial [Coriobacteriia bacterium]|nr:Cna B-type domain-containing protein [Coriobacteriia bacterium]